TTGDVVMMATRATTIASTSSAYAVVTTMTDGATMTTAIATMSVATATTTAAIATMTVPFDMMTVAIATMMIIDPVTIVAIARKGALVAVTPTIKRPSDGTRVKISVLTMAKIVFLVKVMINRASEAI